MKLLLSLFSIFSLSTTDFILPKEINMSEECSIYLNSIPAIKKSFFGSKTASSFITVGRNTATYYPYFGGKELEILGTTENLDECGFNNRPDFKVVDEIYYYILSFSKINFSKDMENAIFTLGKGTPSDIFHEVYVFRAEKIEGKWQVTLNKIWHPAML